ncbi:hypothetical protein ABPG73_022585 [Tetrahymena malaccensis]
MYKSCILFQQCLLIKKVALQKMGMNNIDLIEIESIFSHLREKREELQSLLSHLINRYHQSYILYFLIESFEKSLQCDESLSKQLDREKKLIYTAMNLVKQKKKLTLYSEDSCVIFITLLTNIGIVKKATKNVYDVIPLLKSNELIGKNINYMMNQKISNVHNNILQNFIESHNVDFQVKNYPLLIGIDNQGWAIPYKMKVQTCLIGMNDFGASCWVKQIKDTNLYMQISYNNNFEIFTISQSIYQYILKDVVPQNHIQKVKIGSLMPTLEHFIKKRYSASQNYYESIFLKPNNEEFCYNDNNFKKESNLIVSIFEKEMYRIRADYYTIRHSCIELVQVVISCLEPIEEFQLKIEAARQLLYDFEYFQAYDYEFIDNQRLLLQNYIIQSNINKKHMHINNFYEEQSNQRINELTQSSFEESQNGSVKQLTSKDANDDFHKKSQISTQNISKRRFSKLEQNEQIHNQLANQHYKNSLMDLDKPENPKKQKTKQSLREMTLNRMSNKLESHILSSIQIQENDSNYDALSPHNINSQFQILYPTVFQSGNDLLNSPSIQSNTNIKDLAYSPHTRHMLQMSTHQSRLDSFDSNQIQDLASFHKRNGQSTTYQQQLSKMSSELSSKRISSRTQEKLSQHDNPIQSNKNLIGKQKTSFFFNQLIQKQQSASSQDYFDEHSHKLSKINFNRSNSKKSFKNIHEGSVNLSAKTGDSKKKQKLILELRKPNKMIVLKSIQYFGFLTLLVMIIVNIVNFVQLDTYLTNQKDDYENQDWACRIQVLLTQILGTQGIVNMVRRNPQYLQASENKDQLKADIKSQQQQQLKLLSNLLLEYQDNKLVSNLGNIIQNEVYNLTFAYNATRTIQTPFQIDYSLKVMLAYLYYVAYNQGPVYANTLQLQINLIPMNKQLDIVDDKIQGAIHSTFNDLQTSLTNQQIADVVVASFFSLFFIPIYMYVQKKRQDILVLLSTFGPDKIQMMVDTVLKCELGLEKLGKLFSQSSNDQQHKMQIKKYADEHFFNINSQKSIPIEKKKNISSTTRLPIFKISLIFYATIFIIVNVIYSFAMGFALIPFIDNQLSNLEYTNEVYTIHQFISMLIAYRMQTIQTNSNSQSVIYKKYQQESNNQVQNITIQLNHFYEIINKQSSISRYESDKFNSFNNNLMQNDSCIEAQNNIQYLQFQGFNQTLCDSIANGVFQQGMINSIKYFSEVIRSTDSMLQTQNRTLLQQNLSNHFKQYSLSQYFYYQAYESYFIEIIREFVKQMTLNHYDYYKILNISLMIFQIFSFCISIIFIYVKFFNDCYNSILNTKKLLDVIDVQYLRDNHQYRIETKKKRSFYISDKQISINQNLQNDEIEIFVFSKMNLERNKKESDNFYGRIKKFYLEESYPLIRLFDRPYIISLFLIIFKHFQYFLLQLTPKVISDLQAIEDDTSFLQYGIYFQNRQIVEIAFLYLLIIFNSFILIAFLTYFLRSVFWNLKPKDDYILSLAFQLYYYVVYMISALCSLLLINVMPVASYINLLFTIVIIFIQSMHEYDDRFVSYDYLSTRSSWQRNISTVFEFFSLISYVYLDGNELLIFTFIFYTILLLLELFYMPIYNQQVQILNVFGYIFNIISNINTYMELNTTYWRIYLFGQIIFIPMSYILAQNIVKLRIQNICLQQVSKNSILKKLTNINQKKDNFSSSRDIRELDIYLRTIYQTCKLNYDEYLSSYSSMYLENIIQNHKQYCQKYPYCFCVEEIESQEQRESTNMRSQYLYDYIEIIYQQAVKENSAKKLSNLIFSYLMFVVEVQKNETKAITIVLNYLQNKQNIMTVLQKQRLYYVINHFKQKVEFFKNQLKIANKDSQMQLDFIESINYDSDLYKSCILFQQCLLIKKTALQKMGMNNIDLQQIFQVFNYLRTKRQELQSLLSHLIIRYHQSYILQYLIECFEKSLQFDECLSKQLDREKKQINAAINLVQKKQKLSHYSEDSCVIFITLLQKIGVVKKVTKNVFEVVPLLKSNEVIGKNIDYMMAQQISQVHDDILKNFIQNHKIDYQVKNFPLVLGVDSQGWAIPYEMKIQTCMLGVSDFGAACWVKQIKDTNFYIQTINDRSLEILTISQQLYEYLFEDVVQKKNIQKLKLVSIMPTIESFLKKKCTSSNNFYESIVVKPRDEQFLNNANNFKKENDLITKILEMNLFKVKAYYYPINHSCIDIIQIKISSIEPLLEFPLKMEAANQLLRDFQTVEMFDLDFIDGQRQILQNYITQCNINRKQMLINNYYDNQSNQKLSNSFNSASDITMSPKLATIQDTNEDQYLKTDIFQQNILSQRQPMLNNDQLQKAPFIEIEQSDKTKKQKNKQSLLELTLQRLNNRQDINQFSQTNVFDVDTNNENQSQTVYSQMQILYPAGIQSGNDLMSQQFESNGYIRDYLYSPNARNQGQGSTYQSRLDSTDLNNLQDQNSYYKKNGQSTQYIQQFSKRSSALSSQRFSIRTKDCSKLIPEMANQNNNKIQLQYQKQSIFFNQQAQKTASSQNYFENDSKNFSKTNFHKQSSKKSFKHAYEGSVSQSNQTGEIKKKKQFISQLRKPSKMMVLRILQYAGFLTLLIMVLVNILSFVSLNTYLENKRDDYENQDWASRIQVLLTQIVGTQGIVNIIKRNPQLLQPNENKVQLLSDIKVQQKEQLQLFSDLLVDYQDNKVISTLSDIIQYQSYDLIFAYNATHQVKIPLYLDYSLKNIFAYLFHIVSNQTMSAQTNILQLQYNIIQLNSILDEVDIEIYDAVISNFDNIENSIVQSQIADFIVASIFSFSFIPIYMYVQKKRQEILVLFSTFGPDKILIMMSNIISCELGIEKLKLQFNQNQEDRFIKNQNLKYAKDHCINLNQLSLNFIQKKKNISSTTKLSKFKISLIISAVIFIAVNIIYSFGMGIALKPFCQNQIDNLDYTNQIYKMHQFMSELIAYRMQFLQAKLQNQAIPYNIFYSYSNTLIQNTTNNLNEFYQNMNEQSSISRYDYTKFNTLNSNLMEKNACIESYKNQDYISSQGFNLTQCNSTSGGIFQQGMISAIKFFSDLIVSSNSQFEQQNKTIFQQNLSQHFNQYSLSQYYYYQAYQSFMVQIIRESVKSITLEHYDLYRCLNISLVLFQILAFIVSIIFIYIQFYQQSYKSILETKQLLDLIEIQLLRENQYVLSYFKSLK